MSYLQPFGAATLGKAGLIVIPILVSFSTFGAANGSIYITSRLIFGAARDNLLPDFLRGLHVKRRTPVPALILLVRGTVLVLCFGGWQVSLCTYMYMHMHVYYDSFRGPWDVSSGNILEYLQTVLCRTSFQQRQLSLCIVILFKGS